MYTLKNRKKTWFEVTANKYFIAKQSYTKPATEESSMSSVHDHYVGSVSSGTFLLSAVDVNIKSVHSLWRFLFLQMWENPLLLLLRRHCAQPGWGRWGKADISVTERFLKDDVSPSRLLKIYIFYIFFLVHFCETGVGVSIASPGRPVQPLERNQPCLSNLHTMKLEQQLKTC